MKPVTHALLLVSGLMVSVPIALATQGNPAVSDVVQNSQEQPDDWFDGLSIKERALKTRAVDRFADTSSVYEDAASNESTRSGFVERALRTRVVRRDHVHDQNDVDLSWAFCVPENWGEAPSMFTADLDKSVEFGLSNAGNGRDWLALQVQLPEHLGLRC